MRTLAVVAHPDDESISCGGLIQKRIAAGNDVHVLVVYGRVYDYGRKRGGEVMLDELRDFLEAKKILGFHGDSSMFSDHEGEPQELGYYLVLEGIENVLLSYQPHEVVVPAGDDCNQDHAHVSKLMEIALRPTNLGSVSRVLEAFSLDGRVRQPDWYETLTLEQVNTKIQAVLCYRRETRGSGPRSPEALLAQAKVWGAACGAEFAEGYRLRFARN